MRKNYRYRIGGKLLKLQDRDEPPKKRRGYTKSPDNKERMYLVDDYLIVSQPVWRDKNIGRLRAAPLSDAIKIYNRWVDTKPHSVFGPENEKISENESDESIIKKLNGMGHFGKKLLGEKDSSFLVGQKTQDLLKNIYEKDLKNKLQFYINSKKDSYDHNKEKSLLNKLESNIQERVSEMDLTLDNPYLPDIPLQKYGGQLPQLFSALAKGGYLKNRKRKKRK